MAKQSFLFIGVCFVLYACSPAMISVKQEVSKLSLEEMENPYNLTMRQRNDSDYSAIQKTAGFYRIGEVKINLAKFKFLDTKFNVSSLSFSDSLIYTAIVRVRGSSSSEDYPNPSPNRKKLMGDSVFDEMDKLRKRLYQLEQKK